MRRQADGWAFVMTFEVLGQRVIALNGGPDHKLDDAFSFFVGVETQDEVDEYWEKLTADGPCGWCKDRYGLSWQVIPNDLMRLMGDPDPERAGRVQQAMFGMKTLSIKGLRDAADAG